MKKNHHYALRWYWDIRETCEDAVRKAGFPYYSIMRPGFYSTCYNEPLVHLHFPHLPKQRRFVVAMNPETRVPHVNTEDLGKIYAAALTRPGDFNRKELNIGYENLTIQEVADMISGAIGFNVPVHYMTEEELQMPEFQRVPNGMELMFNEFGQEVTQQEVDELRSLGIQEGTFAKYLEKNEDSLRKCYGLSSRHPRPRNNEHRVSRSPNMCPALKLTDSRHCDLGICKPILGYDDNLFRPVRCLKADGEQLTKIGRNNGLVFSSGRFQCLRKSVALMYISKSRGTLHSSRLCHCEPATASKILAYNQILQDGMIVQFTSVRTRTFTRRDNLLGASM